MARAKAREIFTYISLSPRVFHAQKSRTNQFLILESNFTSKARRADDGRQRYSSARLVREPRPKQRCAPMSRAPPSRSARRKTRHSARTNLRKRRNRGRVMDRHGDSVVFTRPPCVRCRRAKDISLWARREGEVIPFREGGNAVRLRLHRKGTLSVPHLTTTHLYFSVYLVLSACPRPIPVPKARAAPRST